jgi:glyoxylase-like metal-dependent hydrolase (beta-lactamase superfamily II)
MSGSIEVFGGGPLENNTYLILDEETGQAAVVDPTWETEGDLDRLLKRGVTLAWILNTHGHYDHIVNNAVWKRRTGAPLAIHATDVPLLEAMREQAAWMGIPHGEDSPPPDHLLADEETIPVGGLTVKVLHTPGHSPGGVTFLVGEVAIVGDALFAGSIGRTDLPGGDQDVLLEAIRTRLLTLPDSTRVLPGHGPETTIGAERRTNPFLVG